MPTRKGHAPLTSTRALFKVLFIFPSRYLFAIGLVPIFSFRWSLQSFLGCIPKQPDSWKAYRVRSALPRTGLSPSPMCCSKQLWQVGSSGKTLLESTIRRCRQQSLSHSRFTRRYELLVSFPPLINMLKFSG